MAKAKKAIADYKKAIGRPEGLAELSVCYCEEVFTFLGYCGMDDEGYYSALVRMFEQALKATMALPKPQRDDLLDRLEDVRVTGQSYGWGVGDDFNWLWQKAGRRAGDRHSTNLMTGCFPIRIRCPRAASVT